MTDLPDIALSVRQPWAWAIMFAGKDIENRSWQAVNHGLHFRGRVAIHAAKGMTKAEYEEARAFIDGLGYFCPDPHALPRGGIVGSVEVIDVVRESDSPWFFGPRGLVLVDPVPCDFIPVSGVLGFFKWTRKEGGEPAPAARWMLPKSITVTSRAGEHPRREQGVLL